MARKKDVPPGEWQYTVGEAPLQLTAYERRDKKLAIYTRVWDGKSYTQRRQLCTAIRGETGRIDPALETKAQELTLKRLEEIAAGIEPEPARSAPVTLAVGFKRVLDLTEGKYPTRNAHVADVERASKVIMRILGRDLLFDLVRHTHYMKLWRALANAHAVDGSFGETMAERICEALASAARWLQQQAMIEPGVGEPARGWKSAMHKEWTAITGRPARQRNKPRHSPDEANALWAALPQADPRLRLAMELGAELRLGQVIRTRRSDLYPSPDGAEPLWKVVVHGRGKKMGDDPILTDASREVLRDALETGHLAELEAARAAGEIDDFFLMPGGALITRKLPDGTKVRRVPVARAEAELSKTALSKHWRALELLAGVKPMPGRRWYGMRRRQADAVDELEDVRPGVKNRLGGWTKTSTREGYLESGRLEDSLEAVEVRRRVRPARTTPPPEGAPEGASEVGTEGFEPPTSSV